MENSDFTQRPSEVETKGLIPFIWTGIIIGNEREINKF